MHILIAKLVALLAVSVVVALPKPQYSNYHEEPEVKHKHIPILKQDYEQNHEGYQYSYETGNGIHVQEHGYFKNKGDKKHETLVQQGRITYHDEHGHPITLTYIADEHGFQPQGAHLPTPPPLPAGHARGLEEGSNHYQSSEEEYQPQHQQYQQY